jgi:hypothetical protein
MRHYLNTKLKKNKELKKKTQSYPQSVNLAGISRSQGEEGQSSG